MKELLHFLVVNGLVVRGIKRVGIIGQGNLTAIIVRGFASYWMLNRTRASESVGTPLQSAGRYRHRKTVRTTRSSSSGPPLFKTKALWT